MKAKLKLDVVSQEKRLLITEVDSITIETTEGEITILPNHAPLLSRLAEGILRYSQGSDERLIAIFGGFLDVGPNKTVNVLADSAIRAENIDVAKVQKAKSEAETALKDQKSDQDFILTEAAIRKATLELKVAKRHRTPSSPKQL